jgi:hypothetical protein
VSIHRKHRGSELPAGVTWWPQLRLDFYSDATTQAQGEANERAFCEMAGQPWARLTQTEQERARDLIAEARMRGHRHLLWHVPRLPWPLGAAWPEGQLWQVQVCWPYNHGPVVLTARHWGRRYVSGVLRPSAHPWRVLR